MKELPTIIHGYGALSQKITVFRTFIFLLALVVCASCGFPSLDVPNWHQQAPAIPLGGTFTPPDLEESSLDTLSAFGFVDAGNGVFERKADMLAHDVLRTSVSDELPGVDTVAVVSVYRPQVKHQYLYPTLRSLLAELPEAMVINVLVGTGETEYASQPVLERELGSQAAQRVHVIPPPDDVAQYFADYSVPVSRRACWNYSRALRSYVGNSSLMIFEDDVVLSRNFSAHLRPWLVSAPTEALSLFTKRCKPNKGAVGIFGSSLRMKMKSIKRNRDFPTIQAFLYSARVARLAGDYLVLRSGRETHDYMLGRVLADDTRHIGLLVPSPVQHIGFETTGLSGPKYLPISNCFAPSLPPK